MKGSIAEHHLVSPSPCLLVPDTVLGLRQESGLFELLVGGRPLSDVVRVADAEEHLRPNLRLIPGDKRTATAQVVMTVEGFRVDCLAEVLEGARVDYIVFDTSPKRGAVLGGGPVRLRLAAGAHSDGLLRL